MFNCASRLSICVNSWTGNKVGSLFRLVRRGRFIMDDVAKASSEMAIAL